MVDLVRARSSPSPIRKQLGGKLKLEGNTRIIRIRPAELASKRREIRQAEDNMSEPTDWSECPQLCPSLGDIVEVASILPVANANPRPAKDMDPRELATLRMLSRPGFRVRMKHSGVPSLRWRTTAPIPGQRQRTLNSSSALERRNLLISSSPSTMLLRSDGPAGPSS